MDVARMNGANKDRVTMDASNKCNDRNASQCADVDRIRVSSTRRLSTPSKSRWVTIHSLTLGLVLAATSGGEADAKDLRSRISLGVEVPMGIRGTYAAQPPALSFKYSLPAAQKSINMQLQVYAGFSRGYATALPDLESSVMAVNGGARYLFTFVAEDNCNVFAGLGAGVSYQTQGSSTALDPYAQPIAGIEFFPFGLENLGLTAAFMAQAGLQFQGTGALMGAHYYF